MMWPDAVNAAFELVGAVTVWANIRRIWVDRVVRGVDWRVFIFFTVWGMWNLFYYPHLGQWLSFWGGAVITLSNAIWVVLVIYFRSIPPEDRYVGRRWPGA